MKTNAGCALGPRILFVSAYPPRKCGLATFTHDLLAAVRSLCEGAQASVIAVTRDDPVAYPPEVVFEIRQDRLADYSVAAEYANYSAVDVICLQHEFGIFGGKEGRYVTEFLKKARKPVVTTLHTVMREPPPGYRDSLAQVATLSDHLVVLNGRAIPILKDVYGIPEEKISFIHHGVPDVTFLDPSFYKDKFGVEGRTVILTFGLLSRNKGIEVMLDALPEVVRAHAEVVYIVLGATHPEVKRRDGEEYRLYLQSRVRALGLEDHVVFHDQFVELEELLEFIGACDIYVSPYKSKEQIVSGTLAYAVGAGKAVISTPYSYAEELLADGRGRLVPFDDAARLADTLLELIGQPSTRNRMRKLAYQQGRQMIWPEVARHYIEVFERVVARPKTPAPPPIPNPSSVRFIPEKIKLDHLIRLTDDTGLMQHAQQLRLKLWLERLHFIKKQGPAVGRLKQPLLGFGRPRESAFLMAEEFRFDEVFRQRAAVDIDERLCRARAVVMYRPRHKLFARPRPPAYEHGGDGRRYPLDYLKYAAHRGRPPYDPVEVIAFAHLRFEPR